MKAPPLSVLACVILAAVCTSCRAGQPAVNNRHPDDLLIEGTTGSLVPGEDSYTVVINADGRGQFGVYASDDPEGSADELAFEVSDDDLKMIWKAIQDHDFFSLKSQHDVDDVDDGAFAILTITANGRSHQVEVENASVPAFEAVLDAINRAMPVGSRLPYQAVSTDG